MEDADAANAEVDDASLFRLFRKTPSSPPLKLFLHVDDSNSASRSSSNVNLLTGEVF